MRPVIIMIMLLIGVFIKYWHTPSSSHHSAAPSFSPQNSSTPTPTATDVNTDPLTVAHYLQAHQRLPDFYIRKGEARRQGWIAAKGNLCEVLPGRVIGGDRFSNREGQLPNASGRVWQEADVNFRCGHRNSDRLLFSSDGLIYLTTDHYHSFQQVP
ncbi:ribonuclease [Rosenbergiella australiborealis]|uniref:Ribonuclease n=1 Tax=Rosenbergiella australiborealis TaxID=1544696 RepID=A0ABS5T296_9GAMM|nr:ribonuclease domain-containing protein [Rosenbergiella australiborealis]MBT0726473.1 ribonuclease [Rosenbergiella australiborealis]